VYDLRRSILACGLLLAFAGIFTGLAAAAGGTTSNTSTTTGHVAARTAAYWNHRLRMWRVETWHWQRVMGIPLTPAHTRRALASSAIERLHRLSGLWHRREHRAWRHAHHPPALAGWMCIHHYEGAWNDSGGPYWGGLQMDLSFQQEYGGWLLRTKGTANRWTPMEQIWVAVRAWRTRGFSPWPNTARDCGLL
jgi:hypothetical protein